MATLTDPLFFLDSPFQNLEEVSDRVSKAAFGCPSAELPRNSVKLHAGDTAFELSREAAVELVTAVAGLCTAPSPRPALSLPPPGAYQTSDLGIFEDGQVGESEIAAIEGEAGDALAMVAEAETHFTELLYIAKAQLSKEEHKSFRAKLRIARRQLYSQIPEGGRPYGASRGKKRGEWYRSVAAAIREVNPTLAEAPTDAFGSFLARLIKELTGEDLNASHIARSLRERSQPKPKPS